MIIMLILLNFITTFSYSSDLPCSEEQISNAYDQGFYDGFEDAKTKAKEEMEKEKELLRSQESLDDKFNFIQHLMDEDLNVLVREAIAPFQRIPESDVRNYTFLKLKNKNIATSENDYVVTFFTKLLRDPGAIPAFAAIFSEKNSFIYVLIFSIVIHFAKRFTYFVLIKKGREMSSLQKVSLYLFFSFSYFLLAYIYFGDNIMPIVRVALKSMS